MGLFLRKENKRFFCSNLVRTEILLFWKILLFPRDFAVSDSNRKIRGSVTRKEAQIGCVPLQRLRFKRNILLENLIGPSYLELRV